MSYKYVDREFDTRFLIVGKEVGCGNCDNLESFLTHAVPGQFDDVITNITLEGNKEDYEKVVEKTGAMSVPIIVDIENDKHITGFNPPELMELLKS